MTDHDPLKVRATLLLCDWAEAVGGKLYVQGAGWSRIVADAPGSIALAALVHVPFNMTNQKLSVEMRLVTDDGRLYAPVPKGAAYDEVDPVQIQADLEVGRPPGMVDGEETNVPLAVKISPAVFAEGGYRVELTLDDEVLCAIPFRAHRRG